MRLTDTSILVLRDTAARLGGNTLLHITAYRLWNRIFVVGTI